MSLAIKRKVLFVIDTLEIGGAEQSLLVNTKQFKDIEPVICHLYPGETLKPEFIENDIKVFSLNISNRYNFIQAYTALKKVVHEEKPDLIIAYITFTEIVSRLVGYFNHIPVVGTFIADLYAPVYNQHLTAKAKKLVSFFKLLNRLTSRICVGFVANSQAIKESNARHLKIPLHKVKVINRGRDGNSIIKKERKVENSHIRFLNVGRLLPTKAQKELILAFNTFVKIYPDASLHIVGDGPSREILNNIIKEYKLEDKVFLLGARNDVPTLLNKYDCFVFPSITEGFSGSVVEAMFAGLPVLASDISANKEVIQHLHTGYLYKEGSVEAIEQAMLWYKDNRQTAHTMAEKGYLHARENFEQNNIVKQFEHYLLDIIGESVKEHKASTKVLL